MENLRHLYLSHILIMTDITDATKMIMRDLYILTLEGERLNLYLGEEKNAPFESEIVSKDVFPKDDIIRLQKGMVFKNKEDAYTAMENFVN